MANLNKVMLIGRLTRKPELRTFPNGGKVAKFGFAVNNRARNKDSGQWEDVPVWLDCEVFNRGEFGKKADLANDRLDKGSQIFIEGHLRLDSWTAQDGQKRNKLVIVVDDFQFLDSRGDGARGASKAAFDDAPGPADDMPEFSKPGPADEDIPF
ncbi:MAG TPA: single-stranded DNA-binding protein [Gemmatales bacterium]|nr:single-stranded DNA-binding protein [Gemmatales bacterium]HMP57943.1 single-stranded DNA-binding protein [Gemmatales bacterium]